MICVKEMRMWNKTVNTKYHFIAAARNLLCNRSVIFYYILYFCVSVSRITLLADLEAFFHSSRRPLPLLVRILHRSRIRYYGKTGQNIDFPFQVSQCQRFFSTANILGLWSLSFTSSLLLSFRCTVRWLIRVASCLWLYGMIFVLNGSTD